MFIERAYNEGVFKGHKLFSSDRTIQGHLVKGRGYYSLYIKGDFITHKNSFKEIKETAREKFKEMEKKQ